MSSDHTVDVQDGALTDAMIGQRTKTLHKPSLWITITVVLLMTGVVLVDQLLRPGRFTIERIDIHGSSARVDAQTVERTAWLALVGNYFTADLEEIENALVRLPGVYQAAVRRHWPDTLEISITEAGAIALWYATDGSTLESRDYVNLPPDSNIVLQPVLRSPTDDRHTVIDAFLDVVSSLSPLGSWAEVIQYAKSISLLRCSIRFCKTGCRTLNVWTCVMTAVLPSSGEAAAVVWSNWQPTDSSVTESVSDDQKPRKQHHCRLGYRHIQGCSHCRSGPA